MGAIREPKPVILFVAVSGIDQEALDWARRELVSEWGPVLFADEPFDFDMTRFYQQQMGDSIVKQFLAFEQPIDPAKVVFAKRESNRLEQAYADLRSDLQVKRPVNIDPGYVTEAKLVLATTKDRDHRIYLSDGILAEVTLFYQGDVWNSSRWTYPDYKTEQCFLFLDQCRDYLRKHLHGKA